MLNDQTTCSHLGHLLPHSMVIDLDVATHVVEYWCYRLSMSRTISISSEELLFAPADPSTPEHGKWDLLYGILFWLFNPPKFFSPEGVFFFCSTNKLKISPRFLWICGQNSRTIDSSLCILRQETRNPFVLFYTGSQDCSDYCLPSPNKLFSRRWYLGLKNSELIW